MIDYGELDLGYVGEGGGTVDSVDGIEPDEHKNVQLRFFVTAAWWKNAERPLPAGRYILIDGGGDIGPLIDQKIADHNAAESSHPDKAKRYSKVYPVTIAIGEFADYIRITEIAGAIGLSDESEITEPGTYQYTEPVEIISTSGTFSGNASITVDYDLSDLVEKVDGEITERKRNEGDLGNLPTDDKTSLTAAITESYQKALKKLSETTQNLYSNIALKTYTEQGTGQIKAYQLLGTAIDGTIHTLIELAQYGSIQQVEIGSESIHLNLNNIGGEGIDNHITVDTHDNANAGIKLSLAYLTDVVNQCAAALQSAKDYADEKDAALRVDSLIIQPPCNESELPPYDPDNPWEPSHNGYWYQIKDFDISYPGKKGTATWYDDLGEGEPGYYLATDNYGHADGTTTKEDEEGQISVNDITQADVAADTNPFTALEDESFLALIGSIIKKINGAFQLTASLNTMLEYKASNIQSIAAPKADTETPEAVEDETIPNILQDIMNYIAGRVPTNRSFGGLTLSEDQSAEDVKTALNITNFDDDSEVSDDNLHATLSDAEASTTLPETTKKGIRSLLQTIRNNLKAVFANGFVTDVRIGNRTIDIGGGDGDIPVTGSLTALLSGIGSRLKAFRERLVTSIRPVSTALDTTFPSEKAVSAAIGNETSARENADVELKGNFDDVMGDLYIEISRATLEEARIDGALGQETERAENAEAALDAKIAAAITQFTYLVDSDEALAAWAANTAGNNYSSVLIAPGTWTSAVEVDLTASGTKVVVGMPGSILSFNIASGLRYTTLPKTPDYWMEGVTVTSTSTGNSIGFYNCTNLTNCTGSGNGSSTSAAYGFYTCTNLTNCTGAGSGTGSGNSIGFYACTNLTNCTGTGTGSSTSAGNSIGFYNCTNLTNCTGSGNGSSTSAAYGFNGCTNLTNCTGTGKNTGSGAGYGFYNCKGMVLNRPVGVKTSTYNGCYVSISGSGAAPADTAAGGWNMT